MTTALVIIAVLAAAVGVLTLQVLRRRRAETALQAAQADLQRTNRELTREIEERAAAEAALRESERRYRSVFENTGAGTVLSEADMTLSMVNAEFERITGYPREVIEGRMKWTALVHPDDHARMTRFHLDRRRDPASAPTLFECRLRDREGAVKHMMLKVGLIPGTATSVGSFLDISRLKEAEAALQASEARYRQFFQEDLAGAYISRPDGTLVDCNPAFARMFGFASVAEALAANTNDLYGAAGPRAAFLERLRAERKVSQQASTLQDRQGRILQVLENAVGVFDDRGELAEIRGFVIDVTDRRQMERHLLQAARLEAVGTLAGGIAHAFNNLLTVVQGHVSLMRLETAEGHPFHEALAQIDGKVRRAARLTAQLLGFARQGQIERRLLDLNELATEAAETLDAAGRNVTVALDLAPDLPLVAGDREQIAQILLNLCLNAVEAMPSGGCLTLGTADGGAAGVRLTVADTGMGMDPATRERIFEPFFTTKGHELGSGLGLAAVYGIVEAHGGRIAVDTAPGQGTTFRIHFPAAGPRPAAKRAAAVPGAAAGGRGTLLLVDDEEMVAQVGRLMLERLGYTVFTARSGREALAIYERQPVDLVVLDMLMPGMGGGETFDRLRALDPRARVLLASGFSLDGQARAIMARGCRGFIQKPFDLETLAAKVSAALQGVAPPA
jgi:PAS domain S-box-containing protein